MASYNCNWRLAGAFGLPCIVLTLMLRVRGYRLRKRGDVFGN